MLPAAGADTLNSPELGSRSSGQSFRGGDLETDKSVTGDSNGRGFSPVSMEQPQPPPGALTSMGIRCLWKPKAGAKLGGQAGE